MMWRLKKLSMKRINYLLIFIVLIFSLFNVLSEFDRGIVIVLKDASIILTITLPYIVKKIFNFDISEYLIFIWIIFIFLAHYLGVSLELYNKWYYFDKVTHFMSGVLSAGVAFLIIENMKYKNILFNILFIISFTWFCAGMWEVFEFTCNYLFGGDAQKVALTGVSDTMWDMIVAFFGSIIISFIYYFRKK